MKAPLRDDRPEARERVYRASTVVKPKAPSRLKARNPAKGKRV